MNNDRRPPRGWREAGPSIWLPWRKWKRMERKRRLADRRLSRDIFGS